MEKQQDSPPAILCRAGCGFFGHQAFENYCSKCYPTHMRQMTAQQAAVASSGPVANSSRDALASSSSSASLSSSSSHNFASSTTTSLSASQTETTSNSAAVANPSNSLSSTSEPVSIPAPSSSSISSDAGMLGTSPADELNPAVASPNGSATKAPRRCGICNKRTGLTGFECRGCSGWHCTEHRYPDKHSCHFDYKTADRERLRRDNPAVIGEKIQKI